MPAFTVRYRLDAPASLTFTYIPEGQADRTDASGSFILESLEVGTRVDVSLHLVVEVPIPRALAGAATVAIRGRVQEMVEGTLRNIGAACCGIKPDTDEE